MVATLRLRRGGPRMRGSVNAVRRILGALPTWCRTSAFSRIRGEAWRRRIGELWKRYAAHAVGVRRYAVHRCSGRDVGSCSAGRGGRGAA